jgi:ABC-type multidrug transport system fused ATPase/permease subunit
MNKNKKPDFTDNYQLLLRFWNHIGKSRRMQIKLLIILMILASFAEIFSIGIVLPFLAVITSPETVYKNEFVRPIINILGIDSPAELILLITVFFCVTTISSAVIRLLMVKRTAVISFKIGSEISVNIFRRTMYQSYDIHYKRNTSQIIDAISNKTNLVVYNVLIPALTITSSFFILLPIMIALILYKPIVAVITFLSIGSLYFVVIKSVREKLFQSGAIISTESKSAIKTLQEGLGGIRDVILFKSQEMYCAVYSKSDEMFRQAQSKSFFLAQSPRFILEAIGMISIALIAFNFVQQKLSVEMIIATLGLIAMTSQRMLPIIQQSYAAWAAMRTGQSSLFEILELLDQPLPSTSVMTSNQFQFNRSIQIEQMGFKYFNDSPYILKNLNLEILKGERVGIIGQSGSGKSTLVDLIIGLLIPTEGFIKVDGYPVSKDNVGDWMSQIAYVSQSIYLNDGTIEENIAFGIPKTSIVRELVVEAAQKANISSMIEALPANYQTRVGERGVLLSGGQLQRIGIARALYRKASILVMDEATSALDLDTEQAVMDEIDELNSDVTVFIIAHRMSTLKNCTSIIEIENGSIKKIKNSQDVFINPNQN